MFFLCYGFNKIYFDNLRAYILLRIINHSDTGYSKILVSNQSNDQPERRTE